MLRYFFGMCFAKFFVPRFFSFNFFAIVDTGCTPSMGACSRYSFFLFVFLGGAILAPAGGGGQGGVAVVGVSPRLSGRA